MACETERSAVAQQLSLVKEVMLHVKRTSDTLQSQMQTLRTEMDQLESAYNTLRSCLGG